MGCTAHLHRIRNDSRRAQHEQQKNIGRGPGGVFGTPNGCNRHRTYRCIHLKYDSNIVCTIHGSTGVVAFARERKKKKEKKHCELTAAPEDLSKKALMLESHAWKQDGRARCVKGHFYNFGTFSHH